MTMPRAPILVLLLWASLIPARALPPGEVKVDMRGQIAYELSQNTGAWTASNDVVVVVTYTANGQSSNAVLTADRVAGNTNTGDIYAEGSVRIQQGRETLTGPQVHLNYLTRQMDWTEFRAGEAPYFAAGKAMHAEGTNGAYSATNAFVTTDDYSQPLQEIRASEITVVPGKYLEAYNAVLYVGGVPVFYFPYLHRDLTHSPNHFSFLPGYRGSFGPYLLSSYDWTLNDEFNGALHADWRASRGLGTGPDVDFHLGRWGEGTAQVLFRP